MSQRQPIAKLLLLASIIALGVGAGWCTVMGWILAMIMSAFHNQEDFEQLLVTMGGEPVIVRTSRQAGNTEQVLDLEGKPVKATQQDLLYQQSLQHPDQLSEMNLLDWSYRIASANDGGTPAVYWYLMHDGRPNGRAHGIGFNAKSKMVVGYFDRNGFRDTPPPPDDCFAIEGDQALYGATQATYVQQPSFWRASDALLPLLANQKLWVIDVAKRQVKMLLDCPSGQQIGSAWRLPKEPPAPDPDEMNRQAQLITPSDVLVRQPDSVIVVNQRTGDNATFPLPPDCRHAMLSAYLLGDRNLLLIATDMQRWREGEDLVWIAPSGEILKRKHIRLAGRDGFESESIVGWFFAAAAPAPLASGVMAIFAPLMLVRSREADTCSNALGKFLYATWPSIVVVLLVGIACGVAAYRRQKRFGLPHPTAWAVFAFIFGLPGWIAYRFHRTWPVLEECPACHQPSPRDRETCLDCGKAFPPPGMKGIEVFA